MKIQNILFLGETFRADAQTWIKGIEHQSKVNVKTMEIGFSGGRFRRFLKAISFLGRILLSRRKEKYDLILAERSTSYGFLCLFFNGKLKVVAQQGISDIYPNTGFSKFYKSLLQRIVYRNVDIIHAWGAVMVPAMIKSGAAPEKIMILPKGIDLTKFGKQVPFFYPKSEKKIAIVTRSLKTEYCHEVIINATKLLSQNGVFLECWIVGDGPRREELEKLAFDMGIQDRVKFLGLVKNSALPQLLDMADIYLSMPNTEGVSSSLFEAMASGCFPIVSDLPANRAFIEDGVNGFLIEIDNSVQLAKKINYYMGNNDKFFSKILVNRKYIEDHVDFHKNMNIIYREYSKFYQNK